MKLITLYSCQIWDGGERHNHKFYFSDEKEADAWLKLPPNKYNRVSKVDMVVYDNVEDATTNTNREIAKRAIKKLSKEEIHALKINVNNF